MAITPVGGTIYVNQNAPAVASVQSDFQSKLELQNVVAAELANEKKKEVAQIRPTEETYKIDPQNEHEKQHERESLEEQTKDQNEKKEENSDQKDELSSEHKLNIVV
ncbi:hypothetical protein [Campylobacter hyointestinalis]|uniref:Uncharacterized protein n=1 Tax=Campylobacter hyointestinalis subsp. hyointestinalis TaxID=91352 RepID=A0A855N799_CAMHY|nr:hypothetical protein [Campylobacter hyointestinalis]ANE31909.1 hypothetical protein CHH_0195 [Campylobacter hyointestinalis subsp. hyointestinalis LMG 9260]KEA44572.1 hypothetical protein CR67_04790 [Campylobacter hyointestinalis subsp. hyointestinalis]MDL2347116.1 hypothetical protein [Campylobacter hyointestinalis]MDL2348858.1 hypothetical protein [Campylobacter hyointestinalis]MDL2350808.1 hypothetical protein [Campylobacter hyointestinalis]